MLQRDLTETADGQNKLSSKIQDLEKENMMLRNRMDEETHKNKVSVTNVKMDMLKQRGELERDRDRLGNLVEGTLTNSHSLLQCCGLASIA